ncbi:alpha/beta fold hydrolase [Acetobacter garciniae]|nr:alpha/beta hydrolase [Acetobacter garciniae]
MKKPVRHGPMIALCVGLAALSLSARPGVAAEVYGPNLEGFAYPWPVETFDVVSQRQTLHMAYMDVRPEKPNGRTVVLLHGKNFCAATWANTVGVLIAQNYRVIVPDQLGFCKSDKPDNYQFSFQELARNTHDLLAHLGIDRAVLVGHSTGGMLAIRYGLMYPTAVEQLVLVDPIGLEDWKALGVPSLSVNDWYAREMKTTDASIRAYETQVYYAGVWKPAYEKWVQMLAGMYRGPGHDAVAWSSARLYDMIYTQPVVYELGLLRVPTVLMVGDKDTTAIGRDAAPPQVRATLGHYPVLAKKTVAAIPGAKLVEFPDLGHSPQLQDPERFHKALLDALAH